VALRNLAELLHRLGDERPAELILTAADQAPDAPADGRGPPSSAAAPALTRAAVLRTARQAIERNVAAHTGPAADLSRRVSPAQASNGASHRSSQAT
jgi:hypothetical protein